MYIIIINSNLLFLSNMENKQSQYSNYKVGKVDIETEKAFLALINDFIDNPIP